MSETSQSKGPILRKLAAELSGGSEISVITTRMDLETRQIGTGPNAGIAVAQSLYAFQAQGFREFAPDSDLWEFRVKEGERRFMLYLAGDDIFALQVPSAIGY